jgi:arylformamidase
MKRIYEISPIIDENLKVWPGDKSLEREIVADMKKGDRNTSSKIHTTVHLGCHADALSHVSLEGATIDEMPLDHYLGECQVIKVEGKPLGRVKPEDIKADIKAKRVLFATGTFPDFSNWNTEFAGLSPELIDYLAEKGVITIGIDTPSVDNMADVEDLITHKKFVEHKIAIIEGIVLKDVPEGIYELIALPLRMKDLDASPLRAILREL